MITLQDYISKYYPELTLEMIEERINDNRVYFEELFDMFDSYIDDVYEPKFILSKKFIFSKILKSVDYESYQEEFFVWFNRKLRINELIEMNDKTYIDVTRLDIICSDALDTLEVIECSDEIGHYSGMTDKDFVTFK